MRMLLAKLSLVLSAAAAGIGCAAGPDLEMRVDELTREKEDLQRRNTALEGQLAATEARCSALERETRKPAKAEVKLDDELARKGVSVRHRNGETVIDMPSDICFPSGSAALTKEGEKVLRDVVAMIKREFPKAGIRVEGHADSDPIRRTQSKFHCNWELSFERAHAVAHYLIDKGGMDPRNMAVDCYAEFQPQDPANKSKNRRVEIVVAR